MKRVIAPLSFAAFFLPLSVSAQTNIPPSAEPDPAPSQSQPMPASIEPGMSQGALGDWGGLRPKLYAAGLDLQIGYGNQAATNVQGGTDQGFTNVGQFVFGAGVDLQRFAGLDGGKLQIIVTKRHGVSLTSEKQLGLYEQVQEVAGRGNVFRLTQFSYQQSLFDGKLTTKIGRLPTGGDFGAFACDFMNLTFCNSPTGTMPNSYNYWYDWPVSQWGALIKVNAGRQNSDGYVQLGIYQNNPRSVDPTNGFRLDFKGNKGYLIPAEIGWTPNFGGDRPGVYKVGAWYETSRTNDIYLDANGAPSALTGDAGRSIRGRYGMLLQIEQQITPSPEGLNKKGLSVFLNITQLDRRTPIVDRQIAAGMTLTGTFAGRPDDQLAFAIGQMHTNPRVRKADAALVNDMRADEVRGSEYAFEIDYRAVVSRGIKLTPNVQYVVNPGGRSNVKDVIVLGLKSSLSL